MKPLDLDEVEIRGQPLILASHRDVADLERELGVDLPNGYREYLVRLGRGTLNDLVRVLPPDEVRRQLEQHRGMMAAYWFWTDAPEGVDQAWAMESIPIADTLDGDVLVIHPRTPGRIVILPRDLERAYARDGGLLEAVEWVCSGRVLRSLGRRRYFEPLGNMREQESADETNVASQADAVAVRPGRVAGSARDHLLGYFAELRDVEELIVRARGGPNAFTGRLPPPDSDPEALDDVLGRVADVHQRYCTPRLAAALGGSVDSSWPPPHDPSRFQVRDEVLMADGTSVITVAEGIQPGMAAAHVEYRVSADGDGWRIISTRRCEPEREPARPRALLSRLFRRFR